MGETTTNLVGGFLKGLKVLEAFTRERPRYTIAELARATGYDRASCRRLLLTMVHTGYAGQDGRHFWLSPRILQLGRAYLGGSTLADVIQPLLQALSTRIGESCSAAVLNELDVIYIARARYSRVMSISLDVGSRLPAYCSSLGRVLLAGLDPADMAERVERSERVKLTSRTKILPTEIIQAIDQVRQQGYAIIDQELEDGLISIAVPLRDRAGAIQAAINIGTNASRIDREKLELSYLPELLKLQADIAELL